MYRDNHIVNCLDVTASLVTEHIIVEANRIASDILIGTTLLGERPKITCGIICSIGGGFVIVQGGNIELDYKGTSVGVVVNSNTNWIIE